MDLRMSAFMRLEDEEMRRLWKKKIRSAKCNFNGCWIDCSDKLSDVFGTGRRSTWNGIYYFNDTGMYH